MYLDGSPVTARKKTSVPPCQVIRDLVGSGIVPIIAPIGVDEKGQTYNCNADTAAGAIAGALKAHRLLLLTDVAGVLNTDKELLRQIDSLEVGGGDREENRVGGACGHSDGVVLVYDTGRVLGGCTG